MLIADRLKKATARVGNALTPSDRAWHGASVAVQLVAALVLVGFVTAELAPNFSLQKLGASTVAIGALLAIGALGLLAFGMLQSLPRRYRALLLFLAPLGDSYVTNVRSVPSRVRVKPCPMSSSAEIDNGR